MEFLEKVEQCGRWLQQACTTMFSLMPKNVTSERPVALLPAKICWWEALRAPEVLRWQQRYRAGWDASDGRNGGAERTVWETLLEMKQIQQVRRRKGGVRVLGSRFSCFFFHVCLTSIVGISGPCP